MQRILLVKTGKAAGAFRHEEAPEPVPQKGEVRIRVEVSGLNFADIMARLGLYQEAPKVPFVMGYEVVGRIDALGEGVAELAGRERLVVGQRVLAMTRFGGYASSAVAPAVSVVAVPEGASATELAALGTQYTTAYYAAEELVRLHPGDHVLVQAAAGGLGTALTQLAKLRGATVFGTAGSERKLGHLRAQGVDHPIDYTKHDFSAEFLRLSNGRRADVIFDSLGGAAVGQGIRLLASGGRMVCFGAARMSGDRANLFRTLRTALGFGVLLPIPLLMQSKSFLGVNLLRVADDRPDVLRRCLENVVRLYGEGKLRPVVGREFAAAEIAEAHDYLGRRESIGKIGIRWPQ